MSEYSDIFLFPKRLSSVTLKPAAFEDVYIPSVTNKASGGHILNTDQLPNFEQYLNTNKQLFFKKLAAFINFRWATEETQNYRLT